MPALETRNPKLETDLICILGPTGSGKTALSLKLAERLNGEIVSCDSVAVYREFEIGTAKPSLVERARVPHHMIDVAWPNEPFTAGDYSRLAREALRDIASRGKLPIVAGGTGLYLRALLEGIFPGPQRSEELRVRLRERARRRSPAYLHRILTRLDASAAAKIHPNDEPKIIRAIEVCIAARAPMSELWKQGRDRLTGFPALKIGLDPDREQLYARINARAQHMFDFGLVEETRGLLERWGDQVMAINSLGYKQAVQHLRAELTFDEAVAAAQQGHRNYAKRQMTWFRREKDVVWVNGFGEDAADQVTKQLDWKSRY